jgi:hypothetical protein
MEMTVALLLVGGFVVFAVLREVVCWYLKASEQVRLLKAIEAHLEALEARSRGAEPRPATSPAAYPGGVPKVAADGRKLTFTERLG